MSNTLGLVRVLGTCYGRLVRVENKETFKKLQISKKLYWRLALGFFDCSKTQSEEYEKQISQSKLGQANKKCQRSALINELGRW